MIYISPCVVSVSSEFDRCLDHVGYTIPWIHDSFDLLLLLDDMNRPRTIPYRTVVGSATSSVDMALLRHPPPNKRTRLSDWAIKQLQNRFSQIPFYKLECPEGGFPLEITLFLSSISSPMASSFLPTVYPHAHPLPMVPGLCYGTLATYRITFASFLFHTLLSLMTIRVRSSSDLRATLQNG